MLSTGTWGGPSEDWTSEDWNEDVRKQLAKCQHEGSSEVDIVIIALSVSCLVLLFVES